MKVLTKIAETVKDAAFFIAAVPFVVFSSIVISLIGEDHDTWPSEEEMKSGGKKKEIL